MRLLDGSVNVRKSSFSALLRQRLRISGLETMGAAGGVVQSHTPARWFVIIEGSALSCHPLITHPTPQVNPPSTPKIHSSPPKTPPAFLRHLRFHSQHCYPICPSFLHSTLRENVPLWETQHTEHIVWMCDVCLCPLCVCPHNSRVWIRVYLRAALFVSIHTADRWSRILPAENVWTGPGYSPETKPPQTSQTQRALTGILYLSTAVFHRRGSEVTLFSIESSFLWDVRVCETDLQPLAGPLSTRLSQVVLCECVWGGLSVVTS